MFAGMADHFIRQIKISKHFYISQYNHINTVAQKALKKNSFGAIVDIYMRCLYNEDMSFFESESGKNLLEAVERIVKVEEIETPNGRNYSVTIDKTKIDVQKNELNIEKAAIEHEKARQMIQIHTNNALISLLIRFENFLYSYFEWIIKKYPDKYLSEKNITYSELIKFDFDEMKRELTKEAASSIMSQPFSDWLKTIKKHKFDLTSLSEPITVFTEAYYRRNIIVHNNSCINRQYLAGTRLNSSEYPLGKRLTTNKQYILNVYNVSMIIVYGILYASLKASPEDKEEYLDFLFDFGFDHMLEKDWSVSLYIFSLLVNDKSQSEMCRSLSQVNCWISRKNMGQFKEIRDEIGSTDFSAMNVSLRMAKELLLEHYDTAIPLLDEALLSELSPDVVET